MRGADPIVALTDAPTAEEERVIGSGLKHYNDQQSGIGDSRPLAVIVRDPDTNQPIGGYRVLRTGLRARGRPCGRPRPSR